MTQNNPIQVFEGGWKQLENAIFTDNQTDIATNPESHFVRPDGTSVSVIAGTAIETYPIGLPFWDPNQVGSIEDTFTIPDDITPIGHCWNDNGTALYVVGQQNKELFQYTVPTPYTPSSIVAASVSLDLVDVANDPLQVVISRDGDFIFITDGTSVYSFPLPVKDDITSNVSNTVFTPGGGVDVDSFAIKREGDKLYTGDIVTNIITEYVTTAPNIIVGATANGNTLLLPSVPPQLTANSISFRSNGKQFFVLDRNDSDLVRIHLDDTDRDWDISSASLFTNSFAAVDSQSIFWKPDGTILFSLVAAAGAADRIDEIVVPVRWNLDSAFNNNNFGLAGISDNPRGMWVASDGLTCMITDSTTDGLIQLNMSTGWDITTMTDPGISFDLGAAAGIGVPTGVVFTKDQLTFYVTDSTTDDVYQFSVPAPLDIANASFTGNILNLTGMGDITDLRLKPDDKLLYISDRVNELVEMFSVPEDKDISNAVFLQDVDVADQETNMRALFIRENDGEQLFVAGTQSGNISSLDMTLEFNNALISNFGEELTTNAGETIVYT